MIDNGTLDDLYFEWLYQNIGAVRNRNPARSYWLMAKQLYTKPFSWIIPNDDNREADGKELRCEFVDQCGIEEVDPMWMDLECSMFEMLIALARRASFESSGEPGDWFSKFLENLELKQYTDQAYNSDAEWKIDAVTDRVIFRTYKRNGVGGLFPLQNARKDQRKVEMWYQLSSYLLEGGYVDHGP